MTRREALFTAPTSLFDENDELDGNAITVKDALRTDEIMNGA